MCAVTRGAHEAAGERAPSAPGAGLPGDGQLVALPEALEVAAEHVLDPLERLLVRRLCLQREYAVADEDDGGRLADCAVEVPPSVVQSSRRPRWDTSCLA